MSDLTLAGPTLAEIQEARARVAKVARVTPMESSRFLAEVLGSPVHLKCENLQRTGSYKIRGAYNRLTQLSEDERSHGVVAASAGNHAQGVAFAARELGIPATIFMPVGVALPKLQATREYGADVVLSGHSVEQALRAAQEFADTTGAVFIPPFDHPDVIAGQGTVGLEILEQVPDVDTVIVPIGGGGLISGIASALAQTAAVTGKRVRVIGVQAVNAAPYAVSMKRGVRTDIEAQPTIADGIAVAKPGVLNFEIVRDTVDEVVTVGDDDTARAILVMLERAKLVVEAAGAVGVAAVLTEQVRDLGTTVIVLSGGNIDPLMMERVIGRGLSAAERYLKMRIGLPDRPGQLARVSEILADVNANVVEVLHTRHGRGLQISEVELELSVETRGPGHVDEVLQRLRDAGYAPDVDF
ncbi:threonine ammonia-lyase [Frigoribacterium faeni]|uniref:L-threonine dehydratase catabolic TdcB n=1 Tax=Frigoribacterium faeni TaxID=145483 RepID=A0A7W3JIR2_9MICO|nr:threonine ammonia-lyase [Frigoribacterium faeni]MBA8813550.1 threonine dehydratase [Frigoribacterium faeni]GEK84353.1 threonine ammonia-lyase [Frigoribacterium faeni]